MAKSHKKDLPRIFISYAWKNQPLAKKLQRDLQRDGIEVFVDYEKISGGDSLPARISAALDWCNTLILLWSEDAAHSYYVAQEWECAFHLQRRIIPCVLEGVSLPALLRGRLYLDFSVYKTGYVQLCRSLGLESPINFPETEISELDKRSPLPAQQHKNLDEVTIDDTLKTHEIAQKSIPSQQNTQPPIKPLSIDFLRDLMGLDLMGLIDWLRQRKVMAGITIFLLNVFVGLVLIILFWNTLIDNLPRLSLWANQNEGTLSLIGILFTVFAFLINALWAVFLNNRYRREKESTNLIK